MREGPQVRWLPDGRRLHLRHGPIDLIVEAFGEKGAVTAAYRAATRRFAGILDELCGELPLLRSPAVPDVCPVTGPVARRMHGAVGPHAGGAFITPMAAVAGAVADEILAQMTGAAPLRRAYVNNGGDIALHLSAGESFAVGLIDRPDRPSLFGRARIGAEDGVRGIATSGWRGRSFSLGIADAVTILAESGADADAAATVVANAVDLPDHPGIVRERACDLQPDSDLGGRLVTRAVSRLSALEIDEALERGAAVADGLVAAGLIEAAALHLQGATRVAGLAPTSTLSFEASPGTVHA